MERKSRNSLFISEILVISVLGVGCVSSDPTAAETQKSAQHVSPAAEIETVAIDDTVSVEAEPAVMPGTPVIRHGDEIVAAGRFFRTGTPVALWLDETGYDGYRVERRFSPWVESDWETSRAATPSLTSPNRYSLRSATLTPAEREQHRSERWSLAELQQVVDQVVLHYDASGTSRQCFERLHDDRGLSIHFMVDVDGTIYQTLDLKEKAWHATTANSRSIGIEIAQVGAYASPNADIFEQWYRSNEAGGVQLAIPAEAHPDSVRNQSFSGQPARSELITGEINGQQLWQYDLTPEQYRALAHLVATLHSVFPRIALDSPRDEAGEVRQDTLSPAEWTSFSGVLGHYHVQSNKIDPGPALQWDLILDTAKELLDNAESESPSAASTEPE